MTELTSLVSGSAKPDVEKTALSTEKEHVLGEMILKLFTDKWQLKVLLLGVPLAVGSKALGLAPGLSFLAAFCGLIPLAALLGDFTEDLAKRSNDVIGALINVTFGNATELIISIMALRYGMLDVIKLSLIGSVLGNMLLVLGSAFVLGGYYTHDMTFNSDAVNTYGPLLTLSMLSFAIPSLYTAMHGETKRDVETSLIISREIALLMCFTYCCYLVFQLYTHKQLFDSSEEDEEEEETEFSWAFGILGMAVVSILISILSDILVETLQHAAIQWHLPKQFIGIILVPIVGNAAEHSSAIVFATKNRLDISVGVALGSAIQIAMFVMPVLVVVGWIMGIPLDLNFHPFLTGAAVLSVLVAINVTSDGKTNWLEGVMLLVAYLMVAIVFIHGTTDLTG